MQVRFLPSFTTAERTALLAACLAVVYTPPAEHFGIVPLEAMAAARPVIACNQAGPLETVVHGVTGLLCRPDPQAFARGMQTILVRLSTLRHLRMLTCAFVRTVLTWSFHCCFAICTAFWSVSALQACIGVSSRAITRHKGRLPNRMTLYQNLYRHSCHIVLFILRCSA